MRRAPALLVLLLLAGCGTDATHPVTARIANAGFTQRCTTTGIALARPSAVRGPKVTATEWERSGLLVTVTRVPSHKAVAGVRLREAGCPHHEQPAGAKAVGTDVLVSIARTGTARVSDRRLADAMTCAIGQGPCADPPPQPRRTPHPQRPFARVVAHLPVERAPLHVAQVLAGGRHIVARVRARRFCALSPAVRLAEARAYVRATQARFHAAGVRDARVDVGPLRHDTRSLSYTRVVRGVVQLNARGTRC